MKGKDTEALYKELDRVIEENRSLPGPIIQVLHGAQKIFGYLPKEVISYVGEKLNKPSSEVYGVATFYHLFHLKPKGKYEFKVCLGTACYIRGAKMIVDVIKEDVGIDIGEVTDGGLFGLDAVRCIGACGLAPIMMVNEAVYDKLISPAKVREVISKYRRLAARSSD